MSQENQISARLWLDQQADLVLRLRGEGATLQRVANELEKLGRRVQPSQISTWLKKREQEARRRAWEDRIINVLRENNERMASVAKASGDSALAAAILGLEKVALQLSVMLSADQTGADLKADAAEVREQLQAIAQTLKPILEYRKLLVSEKQADLDRRRMEEQTVEKFLAWYARENARRIAESGLPTEEKIKLLRREFFADVDAAEREIGASIPAGGKLRA